MYRPRRSSLVISLVLLLLIAATGCIELFVGPGEGSGRLGLSFRLAESDDAAASARGADGAVDPRLSTTITGSGAATVVLHDIRIVVGEFALEREVGDCATSSEDGDPSCARFVAEPHLLQLSLGELEAGEEIQVSESAPADAYSALEFAVRIPGNELLARIREEGGLVADDRPDRPKLAFADWPEGATAFVSGSYDGDGPDGAGAPVDFRIFFQGEARSHIDFDPGFPLVIRSGETTELSIVMSREVWRSSDDRQVLDLSQLDYDETGEVFVLDPAVIEGFDQVEFSG